MWESVRKTIGLNWYVMRFVLQANSCFYGRLIKEVGEKRFNVFMFMNKIWFQEM